MDNLDKLEACANEIERDKDAFDELIPPGAFGSNGASKVPAETISTAKSQENGSLPDRSSPTILTIDENKVIVNNELTVSPASVPSRNSSVAESEHLFPGQTITYGDQDRPSSETVPSEDFMSGLNVKQSNEWGEQDETSAAVASIQDLEEMDTL